MPLPIAHGFVGASIVALVNPNANLKNWKPLLIGFVLANSPDLDFGFSFLFGWHDFHRGLTHSLIFAFLVAVVPFSLLRQKNWRIPLAYSASFLSHTILDYLSAKSGGVRLLIPFDETAYKFGMISFSELIHGFDIMEMLYFALIETLIFVPLFLLAIFIGKKSDEFTFR